MWRLVISAAWMLVLVLAALVAVAAHWPIWAAGVLLFFWIVGRLARPAAIAAAPSVAHMTPTEYEQHCAGLLSAAGWSVEHRGGQGDQGVDLIAHRGGLRVAIQAKRYAGAAGNASVQQVVAGRAHHGCNLGAVVAPNGYTRSAQELAHSNAVLLLSHADLPELERLSRGVIRLRPAP